MTGENCYIFSNGIVGEDVFPTFFKILSLKNNDTVLILVFKITLIWNAMLCNLVDRYNHL
jgi:hypothetical protein